MAKNVIINGVTYSDVPYVNIPLAAGGGDAKFVDTDSGDAVAADIKANKKAWVGGVEVIGTRATKSSSDVTVNGANVTVPAGLYESNASATVPTEEKDVTPTTSSQEILPTSGKLITKVNVSAVDVSATATEANVPAGITFFANSLTRRTGTGQFPTVSQNQSTKVLTIS